jgi:predicted nucleic acid-binding protein
LRDFLRNIPDDQKSVSVLATLEVRSALERRLRFGEIGPDSFATALQDLLQTLLRFSVISIDSLVVDLAARLIGPHQLRSLDALQLASALLVQDEVPAADSFLFIASDHRLLAAAFAENLPTWDPATTLKPPPPPVN